MDPFEELDQYIPDIIELMPNPFNSHEFILKMAHQHQGAYIRALAQYADTVQPFATVHGLLVKRMSQKFSDYVRRQLPDEASQDIFGQSESAAVWEKIG
jgi:hypothetical protein